MQMSAAAARETALTMPGSSQRYDGGRRSSPRRTPGSAWVNCYGLVVPVPLTSNGAVASDCSELPISRRNATGVVWSLPPKNVDSPVIEYMPEPGLIPSPLADVVSVIVHASGVDGGGLETGTQGLAVAACVRWYSSDVMVGLTLSNLPASPTGGPSGVFLAEPM